ncbi:MAG TPA: DUF3501 family protein [Burkholderiales bacterium]|jgi:hypothetical protein|nr:DUF3501 family protein [Burkholderiales bacterium]
MPAITRESLLTLEAYSKKRNQFRAEVLEHKKNRVVHVGEHVTLIFEDELTMRYQVQEMLRVEKTFEEEGIQDELDAYNPLIPDGSNFKATMMIEYATPTERARALAKLKNVEDHMFVEVEGQARVFAIADEDLQRSNDEKTSAVHFLRFELSEPMKAALKSGAQLKIGCDHAEYLAQVNELVPETLASLVKDLS